MDYIGVDVERLGKADRQTAIKDARINKHELSALPALRKAAPQARLWARLNPLHSGSANEIEMALNKGAAVLTQPQFTSGAEVEEFQGIVNGRARTIPLLEDAKAIDDLDAILQATGDGELMVGLNDLSRSMGLRHPLELATAPLLCDIGEAADAARVSWGFGGVSDPAPRPDLPVQPDDLLSRYAATGATAAWISRSLLSACTPPQLPSRVSSLRDRITYWRNAGETERYAAKMRLDEQVATMLKGL